MYLLLQLSGLREVFSVENFPPEKRYYYFLFSLFLFLFSTSLFESCYLSQGVTHRLNHSNTHRLRNVQRCFCLINIHLSFYLSIYLLSLSILSIYLSFSVSFLSPISPHATRLYKGIRMTKLHKQNNCKIVKQEAPIKSGHNRHTNYQFLHLS